MFHSPVSIWRSSKILYLWLFRGTKKIRFLQTWYCVSENLNKELRKLRTGITNVHWAKFKAQKLLLGSSWIFDGNWKLCTGRHWFTSPVGSSCMSTYCKFPFSLVYEAHSSSVSMAFRSVSCTQSLPVQYRPTHIPGWPEEFKSEKCGKSGTDKDTNRANRIIKHFRTWLPHRFGAAFSMRSAFPIRRFYLLLCSHGLYDDWPPTILDECFREYKINETFSLVGTECGNFRRSLSSAASCVIRPNSSQFTHNLGEAVVNRVAASFHPASLTETVASVHWWPLSCFCSLTSKYCLLLCSEYATKPGVQWKFGMHDVHVLG